MKKIILGTLALSLATFAFAADNYTMNARPFHDIPTATSYTSKTTSGRFTTDVDDFISVTDFTNVQAENFFAYAGYNYNETAGFNFGFAKQLKPFYLGFYFGGELDGFLMKNEFSDEDKANKLDYEYTGDMQNSYTGSILLGFDKFALKASLLYNPVGGVSKYTSVKPDSGDNEKTNQQTYENYFDIQVAIDGKLAPHFELGLDSWVAKNYDKNIGYVDKSVYDLYVRGGITKDFDKEDSEDNSFSHCMDFDLDTRWRITPIVQAQNDKGSDSNLGAADNLIQFTPAYKATVNATEKFSLGAKVAFPLQIGMVWEQDSYTPIDGDKTYSLSRTFNTDIGFVPSLDFGVTYAILPGKVQFNAGTSVALGELGWNITAVKTRENPTKSSVKNTNTTVKFGFDPKAFNTSWNAGFTLFFGNAVTLDASYNILEKLNNNTLDYSSNQDIWETFQDVLVHKLEFLITVKL